MAIRYAVAGGNWSSLATWDGGTLPGVADEVYANGKTVNIDTSVTVARLSNQARATPTILTGGQFTTNGTAVEVTCTQGVVAERDCVANVHVLVFGYGSALNADVEYGHPTINNLRVLNVYTGTSAFINGNIVSKNLQDWLFFQMNPNVSLTINGDIHRENNAGFQSGSTGITITINGNLTSGTASQFMNSLAGSLTNKFIVNGDVRGGAGNNARQFLVSAPLTLVINGDVYGGSSPGAQAVYATTVVSDITIRGNLYGGNYAMSYGQPAVWAEYPTTIKYSGHVYYGGLAPFTGPKYASSALGCLTPLPGEDVFIHMLDANDNEVVLSNTGAETPDEADVRAGTTYQYGSRTGTLVVPSPAAVAAGVPTDATVGTAALRLSDVAAVTGAQLAAAFPID